jgi:RNA polymerase sigma-70 factor (ECF subfamily)
MTVEIQALMDHTGWVQELAHKLVGDPNLADDLAQETMLAALGEGRTPVHSTKAWLGTVLKNLLWQRIRRDQRRRARERRASRPETTPSSAELVGRVAAHREVVNAMMSLPQHYRIVLLRRYFEGETPTGIAAAMDIPLSTVKTRLSRALDLMRKRLDTDHGGNGRAWMTALGPLLGRGPASPPPISMRSMALAASCIVMVAAVALAWPRGGGGASPATLPNPGETLASTDPADADRGGDRSSPVDLGRTAMEITDEVGLALSDLNSAPRPLHGRVFNTEGGPLDGIVLSFTPLYKRTGGPRGTPIGISDAEGRFEIPRAVGTGLVKAAGAELVTVVAGLAIGERRDGLNVVVAPRRTLHGTITNTLGSPIAEARIDYQLPPGFQGRFAQVMHHAQALRHRALSDDEGRFALDRLPAIPGASLLVRMEGYLPVSLPQPTGSELRVTLHRPEKGPDMVEGHVLGPGGQALASVRVSCGLEVTRTDEEGRFLLDVKEPVVATRLIAALPGYLPALLDAGLHPESGEPVWPDDIVMHLGSEPLEIAGSVVGPDGRGLAGMKVWLVDPTVFSHTPGKPGRGYETSRYDSSELDYPEFSEVLETWLSGHSGEIWHYVKTDRDGAFRIPGLAARDYTLAAMDPETLVLTESEPVAAGTDVVLTLDLTALHQSVSGRVLDRAGRPASGVAVKLQRTAFSLRFNGDVIQRSSTSCAITVTGLDGSFSFYDVAREGTVLRLDGIGIVPRIYELDGDAIMDITVARYAHLQVHASTAQGGDQIGVLDENGEELAIHIIQGSKRLIMRRADLVEGRSEVISVPDHAATLVLFSGEDPLRRLPLQLAHGSVNQIRL